MARTSPLRRRTWIALLLNGILLSIGCNPNTLAMLVLPFSDDKVPPECKIITSKKEVTVAIMSSFSQIEDRREVLPAESELAENVAEHMRLRCQANKEKIKIVPIAQVRSFVNRQSARKGVTPQDVGKHFEANYVLDLEINALSLYEKKSMGMFYRGNTDLTITMYDMGKPDGEQRIYSTEYRCEFPASAPRDTGSCSESQFRGQFLTKIAREVSRRFIAYASDERMEMD